MREPLTLGDLERVSGLPIGVIERYRREGLLDPDGRGDFDDYDLLRLRMILMQRDLGHSDDEIVKGIKDGSMLDSLTAELLFGRGVEHLPIDEVAERVGLTPGQIREMRTAIGLSGTRLSADDVDALRAVKHVLAAGLPWEAVLEAARVTGDALRRVAETEIRIAHTYVHEPLAASGADARALAESVTTLGETVRPVLEPLLIYVHRQHLLRAAVEDALLHLEAVPAEVGTLEATILFADLASFTPLAEVHGDQIAAEVLDRFDVIVRSLVLEHRGTLVKQIGDAFMLTFTDPADALRFAVALDETVGAERNFPALRMGIHSGPVLYRVGDYVGNTVNLAARIAAMATAHEILVSEPVAAAADDFGLETEEVGGTEIRGLAAPVPLFRVVRTGARATRRERDPVCGMLVGADAAARLVQGGFEFAFCSTDCLRRFLEDPARYTSPSPADKPVL